MTSFQDIKKRLEGGRTPKVVELYSTVPGYKQLAFGWRVSAIINTERSRTMIFAWDKEMLDFAFSSYLLKDLSEMCGPVYGIAYQRLFRQGPDLYAYGMTAGLGYTVDDMLEADRIGLWFRERIEGNRHLHGMLRDVYPINLITENHLRRLNDLPFMEWVTSSSSRGTLSQLNHGVYLWEIPEEYLGSVQDILARSGLLVCRH